MKKTQLRRSSLSEARVWHKMTGDPCPCPTSIEDLQPGDLREYLATADSDQLRKWLAQLSQCHRTVSAAALINGWMPVGEFLSDIRRAFQWEHRTPLPDPLEDDRRARNMIIDICREVRTHAERCHISNHAELHPCHVPGWKYRLWLASNYGQYTVAEASDALGIPDYRVNDYLRTIGLGSHLRGKPSVWDAETANTAAAV